MKKIIAIFVLLCTFWAFTYAQGLKQSTSSKDTLANPQRAEAQDFNTTRNNRERGQLKTGSTSNTDTLSNPQKAEAQDFNTTRNNRERGQLKTSSTSNTDTLSNPQRAEAQDFNTTRNNRERGQLKTDPDVLNGDRNTPNFQIRLTPSALWPLSKDDNANSGLYNQRGYGVKLGIQYFSGKIGIGFSSGFTTYKANKSTVKQHISGLGRDFEGAVISSTDGNQTFLMLGPVFQLGNKFRITGSAQGGLFINNPSTVKASLKEGSFSIMETTDNNKKYQLGLSGSLSFDYSLSDMLVLGIGGEYLLTKNSILYNDITMQSPKENTINTQSIGINISLILHIPQCIR